MIVGVPWWVFMMIVFIFLSGYMAFRAMKAEHELEQKYIENEGKVYIERIEEARRLREQHNERSSSE